MNLKKKTSIWTYIMGTPIGIIIIALGFALSLTAFILGSGYITCKITNHQNLIDDGTYSYIGVGWLSAFFILGILIYFLRKEDPKEVYLTILTIIAPVVGLPLLGYIIIQILGLFDISIYEFAYGVDWADKTSWFDCRLIDLVFSISCIAGVGALFIVESVGKHLILYTKPTLALYKQAVYLPITVEELLANNIHGPQELEDYIVKNVFSDNIRNLHIDIGKVQSSLEKSFRNSVDTYDFSKIPSDNEHYAYISEVKQDDDTYKKFKESVGKAMTLYMVDWLYGHNKYVVHDSEEPVLGHGNDVMLENMLKYEYLCLK